MIRKAEFKSLEAEVRELRGIVERYQTGNRKEIRDLTITLMELGKMLNMTLVWREAGWTFTKKDADG